MAPRKSHNQDPWPKKPNLDARHSRQIRREYLAVVIAGLSVFLALCLLSYDPRDPSFNVSTPRSDVSNLCGLLGSHVADGLAQLAGVASLLVPLGMAIWAVRAFLDSTGTMIRWEIVSLAVLVAAVAGLFHRLELGPVLGFAAEQHGGAVGAFADHALRRLVGSGGEMVVIAGVIVLSAVQISRISLRSVFGHFRSLFRWAVVRAGNYWAGIKNARAASSADLQEDYFEQICVEPSPVIAEQAPVERIPPRVEPERAYDGIYAGGHAGKSWQRLSVLPDLDFLEHARDWDYRPGNSVADLCEDRLPELDLEDDDLSETDGPEDGSMREVSEDGLLSERDLEAAIDDYLRDARSSRKPQNPAPVAEAPRRNAIQQAPPEVAEQPLADPRPIQVVRRADEEIVSGVNRPADHQAPDLYEFPSPDLLDKPAASNRAVDQHILEKNAAILEQKLSDLGVKGKVVAIHPGPVITMFELALASRVPLRKVLSMADDLAMALKSGSTRVVAPIPGKDTVGIEVPNANREIVHFREIVESAAFIDSSEPLKMALGKKIDGQPVCASLPRMPHLLIAGATGTGKSVGLNCLICSWLMTCHPDDLKLLLVDPKRLELSHYQDIPHLIHPVVTEAEKVPAVLGWAIKEMERRYEVLSKVGSKNIASYNKKVASGKIPPDEEGNVPQKLPYIVIIVDELAELMMVAAKDLEISIARLAQMARASGIHLIVATQRPSVDVITGIIKANFPARLSFQVSAKADSRTILDTVGAECLLGMGDMLFLPPGVSKLQRLHGAYISEEEIRRVVDFIKAQRSPQYLQEISQHVSEGPGKDSRALIQDQKYDEAVELVCRLGHASISLIQRHMRIGYNRAARIMEAMEAEGLVGPSDGTSRPREVLARSLDHIPDL